MQAFRICRRAFADLSGEGARLFGGRWNSPGRAMVYAADSVALAMLEVRVHLDLPWDLVPVDYVVVTIDLGTCSDELLDTLPSDPAAFGDGWLSSGRSGLLRVPSVVAPHSTNVLVNPHHPDAASVSISAIRPIAFDRRLWP